MPKVTNKIPQVVVRIRESSNMLRWQAARSHVSVSRQLAPVDTGFMRDHIVVREEPKGGGVNDYRVVAEADYSIFVEFGTVNMEAQPFFMPGFDSAVSQLRETARALIGSVIGGGSVSISTRPAA